MAYSYDPNGNLLNDGVNSYAYDFANRLVAIQNPQSQIQNQYNGLGDRLQETVAGNTTTFTMDLNTGLTQALSDGTNTYLYGNGRIAQYLTPDTSTPEYFLSDALGSVRQMTDGTGEITFSQNYDPYGVVTYADGDSQTGYGYTNEYTDPNGLVYLRARHYAPGVGRFLTRDTWAGDFNRPLSLNRWGYVEGNPVNLTDPTGNVVCFPGVIGSVLVGTHSFLVGTAIELCKLQYSKTWGIQLYPDNLGAKECSEYRYWIKPKSIADLYTDWLCERGPEEATFLGTDTLTQELARSAVVASIRSKFYNDGDSSEQILDFGGSAFFAATLDSAINQRISITHFLGSFRYKIQRRSGERIIFWISNDTERASGSHFINRFEPFYQGSLEELVTLYPELNSKMVETVIRQYNVISVLKPKTRSETVGNEGGGRMTQVFTWSENDLVCLNTFWPLYIPLLDIGR